MAAGLSRQIIELIESDPTFPGRAVQTIRTILHDIGTEPDKVDNLIRQLGLNNLPTFRLIPVENNTAETFAAEYQALSEELRTRKEADLQNGYKTHLEARGHEVFSADIPVDGQHLRADLYDATDHNLIEVKSSIDRNTIRLGLGQVLDYARIMKPQRRTLLLPSKPAQGVIDLLHDHSVGVVFRNHDGNFVIV